MPSVRRVLAIFFGLVLIYGLFALPAWGTAPVPLQPSATPVNLEVILVDGNKLLGTLAQQYIPIEGDYGEIRVDPMRVSKIDINPIEEGQAESSFQMCNLMMMDKNLLHGRWASETVTLMMPDQSVNVVSLKTIAQLKFLHPKDTSLLAAIIGLITLALLEIVLGVDNVIFIAILAGKLPEPQRPRARRIGLFAALGTRLLLLFMLTYLMGLTKPLFVLPALPMFESFEARGISARDLILLLGGLFLVGKSTYEMHEKVEAAQTPSTVVQGTASFAKVIVMIALVDIVFSLDSVITAIGIVEERWVMVVAMIIAMGVMLVAAESIARIVDRHPTLKVLALSFLILIGVLLVAESLGQHVNKGYIYFAMVFAVVVEMINLQLRSSPHKETAPPATVAKV